MEPLNAHHLRDQLIGLCHMLSADRWESLLGQACRLLMVAAGGDRACLFLTDATGQAVELAAAQAQGDSHWGVASLRLDVGPQVGSTCPLAQVAQTGRLLRLHGGPQGYDFARLDGLLARPSAGPGVMVLPLRGAREPRRLLQFPARHPIGLLPLRGAREPRLFGLAAIQTPGAPCEAETQLRLLLAAMADTLAAQDRTARQAQILRAAQDRLARQDEAQRAARQARAAGIEAQLPGQSPAMRSARDRLAHLADRREPLLILGEDGTGKERAARALHQLSPRRNGAFVYVDCAAMPALALIADLSGYKRGAVPGQAAARRGLLREAAGGTLYLDRLDRVAPEAQVFLARLLETGTFRALGSERDSPVEARLIFAATPDLPARAETGAFLPGLSFALLRNVLRLPALRDRPEDIPTIAEAVLQGLGADAPTLSTGALAVLRVLDYPANLRQLEALVERAATLLPDGDRVLMAAQIEAARGVHAAMPEPEAEGLREAVARFEADLIRRALAQTDGDRAKAADILSIPKRTLADKCSRYAL